MKHFLCLFALTFSVNTFAKNGWVSSGGDLYRSDKNPWFLQNTSDVNYCVTIDGPGISVSADEVKKQISAAIAYWKNEFAEAGRASALSDGGKSIAAKIGTQTFHETDCDGTEDIRFVIGAGKLSTAQRRYLKNVRRHLGLAVRTSYDFGELRGRGFIFIASDQGREKFRSSIFENDLWSEKNMLRGVLVHELGHIFGLPHMGAGLMSEAFAEKIVSSIFFRSLSNMKELPPVLRTPEKSEGCGIGADVLRFLGVTPSSQQAKKENCLKVYLTNPNPKADERMILRLVAVQNGAEEEVGKIVLPEGKEVAKQLPLDFSMNMAGLVFLTSKQKVFTPDQLLSFKDPNDATGKAMITLDYLFGAVEMRFGATARMILKDGTSHSVYVNVGPEGYKIVAPVNGETRLIFKTDSLWFF